MTVLKRAMILAAGFGVRMRPITDNLPKPLVKIHGRTMIDRAIDRLIAAGVETVVVNTHHFGDKLQAHLGKRSDVDILFSPEDPILETGGGIAKALPLLGDEPFFACNGDSLWLNGSQDALKRMLGQWQNDKMDALLMLHSTVEAYGYRGNGDFIVDQLGLLARKPESEVSPYLFTGVQILHPRLFKNIPDGAFSLNVLYNRAIERNRLYGMIHDGEWFHVGTPEALEEVETYMQLRYAGVRRR